MNVARQTFELANDITELDTDVVFRYDVDQQKAVNAARPWKSDPHYFKRVRMSSVALIKMVMHARSGGQYEIMGLMQGKIDGDTFVVMDAFALPVEGTETRVNAQGEANEYMVQYLETAKQVGRLENIVGWYHSHPGYGCWLSGIDVMTQMTNQLYQDPFLAVVIDPNRTISAGRVDIGAFRTYPENYSPPNTVSEYQSIPLNKIEDFGVHANRYYPLECDHFKSTLDSRILDLLWNKYWVMTLSQSPLVTNRAHAASQIADLTDKLGRASSSLLQRGPVHSLVPENAILSTAERSSGSGKGKDKQQHRSIDADGKEFAKSTEETPVLRAVRDSQKLSCECSHGLMGQVVKMMIFNDIAVDIPLPLPPLS